jgi:hypothetical protein
MAYTGAGKRRKILNDVRAALEKRQYFRYVQIRLPEYPPPAIVPAAYIARIPETRDEFTNAETEGIFRFAVVLFVRGEKDIDLIKTDAEDKAEAAIMSLQTDSDFRTVADIIAIDQVDPGPVALFPLGIEGTVLPPEGVVRMDVRVSYIYDQF